MQKLITSTLSISQTILADLQHLQALLLSSHHANPQNINLLTQAQTTFNQLYLNLQQSIIGNQISSYSTQLMHLSMIKLDQPQQHKIDEALSNQLQLVTREYRKRLQSLQILAYQNDNQQLLKRLHFYKNIDLNIDSVEVGDSINQLFIKSSSNHHYLPYPTTVSKEESIDQSNLLDNISSKLIKQDTHRDKSSHKSTKKYHHQSTHTEQYQQGNNLLRKFTNIIDKKKQQQSGQKNTMSVHTLKKNKISKNKQNNIKGSIAKNNKEEQQLKNRKNSKEKYVTARKSIIKEGYPKKTIKKNIINTMN